MINCDGFGKRLAKVEPSSCFLFPQDSDFEASFPSEMLNGQVLFPLSVIGLFLVDKFGVNFHRRQCSSSLQKFYRKCHPFPVTVAPVTLI